MPRYRETVLSSGTISALLEVRGSSSLTSSAPFGTKKSILDEVFPRALNVLKVGGVLPYQPVTLSRGGVVYTRPMQYTFTDPPSLGGLWNTRGEYFFPWSYFPTADVPPLDPSAISYVTNAAIAEAKSETYDALTSVAEMGKTVAMIKHRMGSVMNIASAAGRKSVARVPSPKRKLSAKDTAILIRRRLEEFNNLWLEARYGWRPLVLDIQNAYSQYNEEKRTRNEGRARVEEPLVISATSVTETSATFLTSTVSLVGTRTYRGFALADGSFGTSGQFQPLVTGYELIPYSFVFDWFIDIGSFIQASTPIPGLDIRASGYSIATSYQKHEEMTMQLKPAAIAQGYQLDLREKQTRISSFDIYQRVPSGVVLPRFYPRLTTLRLVDITALVLQRNRSLARLLYRV